MERPQHRAARSDARRSTRRTRTSSGPGPRPEARAAPVRGLLKYEGHAWGMAIDLNSCVGLQRLRRGLPVGEQHPGGGQGPGGPRPRDALDPRGPLLRGPRRASPDDLPPARPLHALRERPLRGGVPGGRHRPQRRGAERHGLQPLRGHAVLLQQLPLQGAALQLLPLPGLDHPQPQDDAQPRRHACAAAG